MKDLHSKEQIDEMRKRLYDRGGEVGGLKRHQLTDIQVDVSRNWGEQTASAPHTTDLREGVFVGEGHTVSQETNTQTESEESVKPKRHYRSVVLIGSLLIFVFVAGLSSLFLYFGGNQISSENILLDIEAASSVGGGEVLALQIGVTNQNAVSIESATLILKYPSGTLSAGDTQRNLFEERIPIDDIASGETRAVPVEVAVFGEENAVKQIQATIEYRINGSNGMFYKEASPHEFRISSSPLVLSIKNLEKVASGQLVDVTLTAVSNGSTPLNNLLITASYPTGFDFQSSSPEPVFAENVWRIDELLPEQSKSITIKGLVKGLTEESFRINFEAGPAAADDQFSVGAPLADSRADFTIERPFIDVGIAINGQSNGVAIIEQDRDSTVIVDITNTLDETVYDMVVEVVPGGSALDETSVQGQNGFYDSNSGTVRWEVSNNPTFAEINPGDNRTLEFSVKQGQNKTTSSFHLVVNVYNTRVAESIEHNQLIGSVFAEGKYSATIDLASQAARGDSRFGDDGPIPPKVGQTTTYTMTLSAEAGANDMVNAVVETSLPLYINWLDAYEADGSVTYNTVSKKLQWVIGDISSGQRKEFVFQVSIQPSISQLGARPTLINRQYIRANDRFTGALLQDDVRAVTTELSRELGFQEDNGVVER